MTAPWHGIAAVATLWGFAGITGLVYGGLVFRRMRAQAVYQPVFEDRMFHFVLPFFAYAILTLSALIAHMNARSAMFMVGASTLLLMFIGIHNAWDTVMYQVFVLKQEERKREERREESSNREASS